MIPTPSSKDKAKMDAPTLLLLLIVLIPVVLLGEKMCNAYAVDSYCLITVFSSIEDPGVQTEASFGADTAQMSGFRTTLRTIEAAEWQAASLLKASTDRSS